MPQRHAPMPERHAHVSQKQAHMPEKHARVSQKHAHMPEKHARVSQKHARVSNTELEYHLSDFQNTGVTPRRWGRR